MFTYILIGQHGDWICSQSLEHPSPSNNDDSLDDLYEPMWYILQQLSCPAIDGKITPAKVKEHITKLDSIHKKLMLRDN